jgi:hypothetical protein
MIRSIPSPAGPARARLAFVFPCRLPARLLLAAITFAAVSAHAGNAPSVGPEPARYSTSGVVAAPHRSSDGRFTASGDARFTATTLSNDGRFSLKSTNADCAALPDALFANGFEL